MTNFDAKAWIAEQDPLKFLLSNYLSEEDKMMFLESIVLFTYSQGRTDALKDAQEDRK